MGCSRVYGLGFRVCGCRLVAAAEALAEMEQQLEEATKETKELREEREVLLKRIKEMQQNPKP